MSLRWEYTLTYTPTVAVLEQYIASEQRRIGAVHRLMRLYGPEMPPEAAQE